MNVCCRAKGESLTFRDQAAGKEMCEEYGAVNETNGRELVPIASVQLPNCSVNTTPGRGRRQRGGGSIYGVIFNE